jgi:hypothetical protein
MGLAIALDSETCRTLVDVWMPVCIHVRGCEHHFVHTRLRHPRPGADMHLDAESDLYDLMVAILTASTA